MKNFGFVLIMGILLGGTVLMYRDGATIYPVYETDYSSKYQMYLEKGEVYRTGLYYGKTVRVKISSQPRVPFKIFIGGKTIESNVAPNFIADICHQSCSQTIIDDGPSEIYLLVENSTPYKNVEMTIRLWKE